MRSVAYRIGKIQFLVPSAVILFLSLTLFFGPNHQTLSDANGTVLTSLAILEHGSPRLDPYQEHLSQYTYQIHQKEGHYFYYFPIGSPLISTPFVGMAKLIGIDVIKHDKTIQLTLALLALLLTYWLMYLIAVLYLNQFHAQLVSAITLFGTSFISTGSTALWSHNFATLLALLSIYLYLKQLKTKTDFSIVLGFALFLAYLCRPTMALIIPIIVGSQLLYTGRPQALKTLFAITILSGIFLAWSQHTYNQLLPDYYLPKRLESETFWQALWGNYFSPSRGLFVFSPIFLISILGLTISWKNSSRYSPELTLLLWPILHSIAISKFPHWWAGFSYGPRLMYDVLPVFFLMFVIFFKSFQNSRLAIKVVIILSVYSILVHYVQGTFNRYAANWNASPNIDQYPEYLFDWRYPQFLYNPILHSYRLADFAIKTTSNEKNIIKSIKLSKEKASATRNDHFRPVETGEKTIIAGKKYYFDAKEIAFINWHIPETHFRWSDGFYSEILFIPELSDNTSPSLHIDLVSLLEQEVYFQVNESRAMSIKLKAGDTMLNIDLTGVALPEEINALKIEMPSARSPNTTDTRILSLAFKSLYLSEKPL